MIVDYHMHLRGPADGHEGPVELTVEAVERFVEQARKRGVDEIAFTEHMYYFRQAEPLLGHPYQRGRVAHDLDDYCDAVLEAKARGLPVKLALELEWLSDRDGELAEILRPYPWDFLLGSVHLVDGVAVDMESDPGLWDLHSVDEVWRRYFHELGALARSGLADVLAHPDLVKIFGRRPEPEVVEACHEEAVVGIAEGGMAVEVSTAGLRKPVGELYPDKGFPRPLPRTRRGSHARLRCPCLRRRRAGLRRGARAPPLGRLRHRHSLRGAHGAPGAAGMSGLRVGIGVDAHAFSEDAALVVGGVEFPGEAGLAGHSDGDVVAHALVDAILGAAGLGDIGSFFPSDDAEWEGASSLLFLERAVAAVREAGFELVNADCVLIGERPRIAGVRAEMESRLAAALGVGADRVSVRATTTDGLGFTGRGEGLAAQAVALLAAQ